MSDHRNRTLATAWPGAGRALALGAAVAVGLLVFAWFTGWLKTYYYFRTLGIDSTWIEAEPIDRIVESWFVIQNLTYVAMMGWMALRTRRVWVAVLAVLHALLPIVTHYGFDVDGLGWLVRSRHTWMKFVPFVVLGIVCAFDAAGRRRIFEARWPLGRPGTILVLIVLVSWGISAAKHFGSHDASLALADPDRYLPRVVRLEDRAGQPLLEPDAPAGTFYLIHANDAWCVVWNGSEPGDPLSLTWFPAGRVGTLETGFAFEKQPGAQYF